MKNKWLLFSGLFVLTLGVVLKLIYTDVFWPVIIILAGVVLKVIFILKKMGQKRYKPGIEMIFLITGLLLFFSGIYISGNGNNFPVNAMVLKVSGISLKVVFVLLFLRKTK